MARLAHNKVALSFPRECRDLAQQVGSQIERKVGRGQVIYDEFDDAEFPSADLARYLQDHYRDRSDSVVVFLLRRHIDDNIDWLRNGSGLSVGRGQTLGARYVIAEEVDLVELGLSEASGIIE